MTDAVEKITDAMGVVDDKSAAVDASVDKADGAVDKQADKQVAPDFPANWQEKMAGGDEKVAKLLSRYTSPAAVAKALHEGSVKLSSIKVKNVLPKDATPEQLAEYRKAEGLPETPDKYDISLGDFKIPEADKSMVDEFLSGMHAVNAPNDAVKAALGTYYRLSKMQNEAMASRDSEQKAATQDKLRAEWGEDYRRNENLTVAYLESMPRMDFMEARLPDGTKLGNDPAVVAWFAQKALEINPMGTIVPGNGQSAMEAIDSELATLVKKAGDYSSDYWKGADAAKMQARLRELNEAKEKYS